MPRKPQRPCNAPRCGAKTDHRSGYCEAHRSGHWGGHYGQTAHQRGYGYRWRKLRRAVLRDEPRCQVCLTSGRVSLATQVDHITPKSQGGDDSWDNLQSICDRCHKAKTAEERK